ncbi:MULTISPECIES: methyltransferase domain-containing protein [unclassified Streptomyces]|uniref:class I SAM-dependent methyltransferase n=1 Tax=unclassified Streptomyces TaxID=2593676 RepID=UPI00081EC334|nr:MULTISPECIES: methyltransferase domain-containing protein [unclassified Streptomyces]MYZ38184.1 methyltransferase domain-containing protein [Streptomyces sp. SID4917]SCF96843.1 Phospholipid N-methyltransferase [Streptomyces sp. MnatMP-M17]
MTADTRAVFLREFLRNPFTVASITPSGEALADLATAPIPDTGAPLVVELGPGTGSFTGAIQRRLAGRGHHLAVEINERFAGMLTARYPGVEVAVADARNVRELLAERGYRQADVIVSGLPWAAFSSEHQDDLLDAITDILAPDGTFTTFAYTHTRWAPPARRLRDALGAAFEETVPGRTVWANVPPAFVYSCRRLRVPARQGALLPV